MAEERAQRRLAAILAADVVGYSRLMEQDEAGTLAAIKAWQNGVLEPLVARYQGRVFKVTGDGVLVEFASAVNAVQCATDLQQEMAAANALQPEGRQVVLRIGVNLGDVVVEGDDLYGDGVNIASRLEAIADPGGILVSGTTHDHVGTKIEVSFQDLSARTLKNIVQPIRVYRVAGTPAVSVAAPRSTHHKPSIAVLPFTNISGDRDQEYFSDGITEDIITELSRFRQLHVLARSSSFRYRDKDVDPARVGRELGVQYVVEGSVRRIGTRLRLTAQLIDATSSNHLWAERFDSDQKEIFTVQDQFVRTIVGTLFGRLEAVGVEQAGRKPPASLAAYECVLRGKTIPFGNLEAEAERRRLFERAIELDPSYGRAYAWLGHTVYLEWFRDMTGSDITLDRALELAKKAVALDENDGICLDILAWIHLFRRSFDLAERLYRRALELNPNNPEQVARMGYLYTFLGRPNEAFDWLKQARLLDPYYNPISYCHTLGYAHFVARQYQEAIVALSQSPTMPFWAQTYMAASCALAGDIDRAKAFAAEVVRLAPNFSLTRFGGKEPYKHAPDRAHFLDGMRKAGLPE